MYVIITVGNMAYSDPLNTYPTFLDAWNAGYATGGWYVIERIY